MDYKKSKVLSLAFLLFDYLHSREFFSVFLVQSVGNKFYVSLKFRYHYVFQRVGAFLSFLYRVGKSVNTVFDLSQAGCQNLYLCKLSVRVIQRGVGGVHSEVNLFSVRFRHMDNLNLHTHN